MSRNNIEPGTGEIYSVSQLNREVRTILEGSFRMLWIEGEISNLAQPASGHLYFSLKDSRSQVRCAMFRSHNNLLRFQPENGMQVLIYARVSLYEARGEFQLIADRMEPAGEGALQLAFEQLKKRLEQEGLFSPLHKKELPEFPRIVGIVTSPTGAAIRDVLSVLGRRFPALEVIIYPTQVQGETAAQQIARMINLADKRKECDVLIVTRGGGSLEDLWSFNEEVVARAIHACETPVVVGVGHEIDFTIADFVADVRAPTPSAAAELISFDQEELKQQLTGYEIGFRDLITRKISQLDQKVNELQRRLVHPGRRLEELSQRLDDLSIRMNKAAMASIHQRSIRLSTLIINLKQYNPEKVIAMNLERCQQYRIRIDSAMLNRLEKLKAKLSETARTLQSVSPLNTLHRGYAIMQKAPGQIIRTSRDVGVGDRVTAQLSSGALECTVDRCLEKDLRED